MTGQLHQALFSPPRARICVPVTWQPAGLSKLTEMNLWAKGRLCSGILLGGLHTGDLLYSTAKESTSNILHFLLKWGNKMHSVKRVYLLHRDQFGNQCAWISLTANTPTYNHKLSINVCLHCISSHVGNCSCVGEVDGWSVNLASLPHLCWGRGNPHLNTQLPRSPGRCGAIKHNSQGRRTLAH